MAYATKSKKFCAASANYTIYYSTMNIKINVCKMQSPFRFIIEVP